MHSHYGSKGDTKLCVLLFFDENEGTDDEPGYRGRDLRGVQCFSRDCDVDGTKAKGFHTACCCCIRHEGLVTSATALTSDVDVNPVKDSTCNKDCSGEVLSGFVADVSHRETNPPSDTIYFLNFQSGRTGGTAHGTDDKAGEDENSDETGSFFHL
jgi:hypothetical protein